MNQKIQQFDIIIIGAGIVGLSIAKELIHQNNQTRILILEKEADIGLHSSGRNSGVLHSGIYYPSGSLKAQLCSSGAKKMADYCEQNELPLHRLGKVIVPFQSDQSEQLETLYQRGINNGASVELIDAQQLNSIEPEAYSATGKALYSPNTAVIDPLLILVSLKQQLIKQGVIFYHQCDITKAKINSETSSFIINHQQYRYSHLYNAAGLYADKVAKLFSAAKNHTILPFRGNYYQLSERGHQLTFNGLIYPVPDLNQPFLGVHSVKSIKGDIYFGPSALPAWGRENYQGLDGFNFFDSANISKRLIMLFLKNNDNFRHYLHNEVGKITKNGFTHSIQQIIPSIKPDLLKPCSKVGIRAQLLNTKTMRLEMDFMVEYHENTTHILNAVSPAFTSAFEFSDYIVNKKLSFKFT